MKFTGNDYGIEAHKRLSVVRGKDFRKEKNKFKKKSSYGVGNLEIKVRAIKIEDSDSD